MLNGCEGLQPGLTAPGLTDAFLLAEKKCKKTAVGQTRDGQTGNVMQLHF